MCVSVASRVRRFPKMSHFKERFVAVLHEKNFVTEQLEKLEGKTGIKREYITVGMSATL